MSSPTAIPTVPFGYSIPEEEMEFEVDFAATLFMCIFYLAIGFISVALNISNIITYSNRQLRRKYMYQLAYEAFELIDSVSYILTGMGRGSALLGGYFNTISVHDCFYKTYWVHSLILGMELPCYMVILMSIERICAATRPALYKNLFSSNTKMRFVGVVVLTGLISLAVAAYSAYGDNSLNTTRHCAIISSTHIAYSTFHFSFVVFAYVISFISLVSVYCFTMKVTGLSTRHEREKKFLLMIVVTAVSIVLVSMPSIVMLGIKWGLFTVSDTIVAITYGMPGMLTIANTIINMTFRKDYRDVFRRIFCCSRGPHASRISSVSINKTHHTPRPRTVEPVTRISY